MTDQRPSVERRDRPVDELREALEAVIALVPVDTGTPPTQWQRNHKARREIAIARARAAVNDIGPDVPDWLKRHAEGPGHHYSLDDCRAALSTASSSEAGLRCTCPGNGQFAIGCPTHDPVHASSDAGEGAEGEPEETYTDDFYDEMARDDFDARIDRTPEWGEHRR
jgi:hypothetical protein